MMNPESITFTSILLVDDEPDNVELIADTLEFMGMEVKTAKHGEQGLAILKEFTPDLILLDLSMPVMDGWKMHKQLKSDPKTQHIPVVALTAHAMAGDKERALGAGFDGYVSKPISVATFLNDLRSTLQENAKNEQSVVVEHVVVEQVERTS